jgi:site-specific DNA-methyltransferase (adenine-specific)
VLDPFSGSGTTLRVCQQLNRNCTGIEINPEYVEMSRQRLGMEFQGFDSIDPRMERVPFDLRRQELREEYLANHKRWFLRNHENAIREFEESVESLYGKEKSNQLKLLDE